ncbi:MAG: radical SAM protein [Candidatus Omnitrophica bacterium]|nr:radical SAM protein [Candidatus Omnitrophota bacterium]
MNNNSFSNERFIKRLSLCVGYSCTNNCRFCAVASKRSYPDKTTEQIKTELKESYLSGSREVVFTGGEFTIRKDVFEIVKTARDLGYYIIQAQTNGRRFSSKEFCKNILLSGLNEFGPALHGHTAQIHDFLTRREGSFRQTVLGIYNMKKMTKGKIKTITNTVVTKYNYKYLPQIADLLIKLGVDQCQFAFVHAMGNAGRYFRSVVPKKTDVLPYLKKAINLCKKNKLKVMAEAIPFCLMEGYERYVSELYIPSTELRERGNVVERFEDVRKSDAKAKFIQCRQCIYDKICEGPWKEYPQHYGDKEFKPVRRRSEKERVCSNTI